MKTCQCGLNNIYNWADVIQITRVSSTISRQNLVTSFDIYIQSILSHTRVRARTSAPLSRHDSTVIINNYYHYYYKFRFDSVVFVAYPSPRSPVALVAPDRFRHVGFILYKTYFLYSITQLIVIYYPIRNTLIRF